MQSEAETQERTYVETSRTGALLVELDGTGGVVRVQLEPEVNATWSADTLSERLMHLHRLALMRARFAQRQRMNELGAICHRTTPIPVSPRSPPTAPDMWIFEAALTPEHRGYAGKKTTQ